MENSLLEQALLNNFAKQNFGGQTLWTKKLAKWSAIFYSLGRDISGLSQKNMRNPSKTSNGVKKTLRFLELISKAVLLALLLIVGWVFVNITNLVKEKKKAEKDSPDLFDSKTVYADTPGGPPNSCPHVAYFDGKKFLIENDFLLGKPQSFLADFGAIKHLYEAGRVGPDLLKFHAEPQLYNGKLTLRLQEIEVEETFVKWLKLFRVIHPRTSEVVVNSNFTDFHVYDREYLKKNIMLPLSAQCNNSENISHLFQKRDGLWGDQNDQEKVFEKNDEIRVVFRNLKPDEPANLIVKSMHRDWMAGEAKDIIRASRLLSLVRYPHMARVFLLVAAALHLALGRKTTGTTLALLPFIIGGQTHSMVFSYRDLRDKKHPIVVHEPRDWRYATERIDLPPAAVQKDGSLTLLLDFTNRHKLDFLGVIQGAEELTVQVEELSVEEVKHSRLGKLQDAGKEASSCYIHMIPGDTVDVAFQNPTVVPKPEEKVSCLMQSSGFYTALREENKVLAGNWQERISEEAHERLASLDLRKSYKHL